MFFKSNLFILIITYIIIIILSLMWDVNFSSKENMQNKNDEEENNEEENNEEDETKEEENFENDEELEDNNEEEQEKQEINTFKNIKQTNKKENLVNKKKKENFKNLNSYKLQPLTYTEYNKTIDIYSDSPGNVFCKGYGLYNSMGDLCLNEFQKKMLSTRGGNMTNKPSQISDSYI